MRKYTFLILLSLIVLLFSCNERETMIFNDVNEVFFDKFYVNEIYPGTRSADSTVASFFLYPTDTKNIDAKLVVELSGKLLNSDIHFGLKVVEDETTANPDEYTIDDFYVFHAKNAVEDVTKIQDVIKISLHRTPRLENMPDGVKLVVELVPNNEMHVGQIERIRAKIIIVTVASQPDWWTEEVAFNLLGDYSQKKYKLFLDKVDIKAELDADLIKSHPDKARKLAMQFKQWLSEQNPVIKEDDGTLMVVTL